MSIYPPMFDFESLQTEADIALRESVSAHYSPAAADYLAGEHDFRETDWKPYSDAVKSLIEQNEAEAVFIARLRELNFSSPMLT